MKKTLFFLALLGIMPGARATILSVNNEPGAAADYSDLPAALTASVAGDTIYLYPGTATYGQITIDKPIFILGPGHLLDYTGMVPQVDAVVFSTGSTGAVIKGIRLWFVYVSAFAVTNDVLISGCLLSAQNPFTLPGNATMNNWIIEGCVIYNQSNGLAFNGGGVQNWILRNNIITHWNAGGSWLNYATNFTVENNIFIQSYSATASGIFGAQCTNIVFNNNIIYYTASSFPGSIVGTCVGCSMNNNLTYSPNGTMPDLPGNNLNNLDPQFVNVPSADPFYGYEKDYHLANASPAIGAGINGTDIGVYGGIHAFRAKGWSNTMPRIGNLIPLNNFAPPGGQLQFNLKAYAAGNE